MTHQGFDTTSKVELCGCELLKVEPYAVLLSLLPEGGNWKLLREGGTGSCYVKEELEAVT